MFVRVVTPRGRWTGPVHQCGVWPSVVSLAGIEAEWRRTQCVPREVCVDVGREFGAPTNIFYKPPCVSVYRCGGCCHSEDKQCRNISTGFLSKTVSTPLSSACHSLPVTGNAFACPTAVVMNCSDLLKMKSLHCLMLGWFLVCEY